MATWRRWFLVPAAALIAVVVAGCSGSAGRPGASGAPVVSEAPSVTVSVSSPYPSDVPLTGRNTRPGEKPPVYPEAARANTQAGANAFAEFFIQTWDWAYATTNPSYMKHYVDSSCRSCNSIAEGIANTAAMGHWFVGDRLTVRSVSATQVAGARADFCSSASVDSTESRSIDASGRTYHSEAAGADINITLCLEHQPSGFLVMYLIRKEQ